ncbi:hypothetical protein BN1263170329 [Stenotrophomonas maltophilia]
MKQND